MQHVIESNLQVSYSSRRYESYHDSFSRNTMVLYLSNLSTPCHTWEHPPTLSLAARPYFVFACGGGRKVGSSRMCKFHTSRRPMKSLLHHFSAVKGVYAIWNTWNHTDIVYATLTVTNKRPFGCSLRCVEFTHSARPYISSAPTHEDKVGSSS